LPGALQSVWHRIDERFLDQNGDPCEWHDLLKRSQVALVLGDDVVEVVDAARIAVARGLLPIVIDDHEPDQRFGQVAILNCDVRGHRAESDDQIHLRVGHELVQSGADAGRREVALQLLAGGYGDLEVLRGEELDLLQQEVRLADLTLVGPVGHDADCDHR